MHKTYKHFFPILVFTIIAAVSFYQSGDLFILFDLPQVLSEHSQELTVSRVIDGDTIELSNGTKVRYIGIDTPEIGSKPECWANEAKEANKKLVLHKTVRLEKDVSETDRYGRLLRYVYADEIFVNAWLVDQGYAVAASFPPDVAYQNYFSELERRARESEKGLWSACPQD